MNYFEFVCAIEEAVSAYFEGNMEVTSQSILKNNDKERVGIVIKSKEIGIAPTIYLEEFFSSYEKGKSINHIVDRIVETYEELQLENMWDGKEMEDFESMKNRIAFKLINKSDNRQLLEEIPFLSYLDLAIVFFCYIEEIPDSCATILLKNNHMEMWGVDIEQIFEEAFRNTEKLFPKSFKPMNEVLLELMGEDWGEAIDVVEETEEMMYVLTNQLKCFGAATMIYEEVLKEIGERLGEDFYVLPSSVHELIIVPLSKCPEERELNEMICDINDTQVEEEEVLSNHAYFYNKKEGRLLY